MTLLTEATEAEIAAELARRKDLERLASIAAHAAWNEQNADVLLRILTHNPKPFQVREGPLETFVERTCTDGKLRENKSTCVRCALIQMIETKNWAGFHFHINVTATVTTRD